MKEYSMSTDLWPEFDVSSKSTPKTIIEKAGADLEKKTKGLIKFNVHGTRISEGMLTLECGLYSPTLSYQYPFLKVRFPVIDGYPVELVADKVPDTLRAANEEELLGALGKVFRSPSTIDTIQKLIALS
jgi:hypothetical protein